MLSDEKKQGPKTLWEMSPNDAKAWLDAGNTFVLPQGQGRYVMRRVEGDGSYIVYHYDYSTFGQLVQHSARFGSYFTQNEPGVAGVALYDVPFFEQKERLDAGEVFTAPISNGEYFKLCRMPDGAYVQYIPQRETFEAAMGRVAQYGPAHLWEKTDESGELVSLRSGQH